MKISRIFALLLLCFCMLPKSASADPAVNRELIKKAGIEAVVIQIPDAMASGVQQIEQQGVKVDDKFRNAWTKASKTAFRTDRMIDAISKSLEKLTDQERRSLIAYYDTPAGKLIRVLEEKASTAEAQAEIAAYAPKFMADPKSAERVKLYQQIDEATNASAVGTELGMRMAHITAIGMANAAKGTLNVDTAQLEKQIESQRPQMAQQMKQTMMLSSAYTYRELSVAEIKAYLKFLKMPATQKFTMIVLKSLSNELIVQGRTFATELGKIFKRKDV
jgi:hypothetical protein